MKITAPHLLLCLTASLDRISTPQNWSYPKYCFCLHLYCIHFSKHTQTIFLPLRLCRHQSFSWLLEHMISDRWPHTWRPIFWPNAETALKEKRKQKQETLGPPSADPLTMQGPVLSAPTHTELQRHAYTPGSRGVCVWTVAARTGLVPQLVSLLLWWNSLMLTEVSFENKHTTLYWSSSHARNNFMSFWKNKIHLWLSQQVKNDPGISPMCLFLCMRIYWIIQGNVHTFKSCSEMKWNDRYSSPGFS